MEQQTSPFWSLSAAQVLGRLKTTQEGLSTAEAASRLKRYAARRLVPKKRTDTVTLLLGQFSSPIVLLLLVAAVISLFLRDTTDAAIILGIVVVSGLLGFWQERGAAGAVEKLLSLVEVKAQVLRDGRAARMCRSAEIVPATWCSSRPGPSCPPTACSSKRRISSWTKPTLTGETFPAEKAAAIAAGGHAARQAQQRPLPRHARGLRKRPRRGGRDGKDTEFGAVAARLSCGRPRPISSAACGASATCCWRSRWCW